MPRPKVDPKNRKRSVRACVSCKASKIRCDSRQPCSRCHAKGKAAECVYSENVPQSRNRAQSHSHSHSHSRTQVLPQSHPRPGSTSPQTTPQADQSRLLLSSKGEKVYIGHTASLSYLAFMRHVFKMSMGPSAFTESDFNNIMLEIDPSSNGSSPLLHDFDSEQKRFLIEAYTEATNGFLDLFTPEECSEFITSSCYPLQNGDPSTRKVRYLDAAFKLATAIGIQGKSTGAFRPESAAFIFSECQRFAFEGMLCDVSLDVVRIFLLMAFYMLGSCQRNAAFMYLGIASKAASALGLSNRNDQGRMLNDEECSARRRIWESLCVMDTTVSAILGRCSSCPPTWPDDRSGSQGQESDGCSSPATINAAYEMCSLINTLEQDIWRGSSITSSSAESFLYEVRQCSQQLAINTSSLSYDRVATSDHEGRKKALGATHIACAYYFTVILATRPFLTSHLMLRLKDRGSNILGDGKPFLSAEERLKIANLSQVCLDAAKLMANMLSRALDAVLLLENMCIVKAWVFGAGLLLGFYMFVEESTPADLGRAFKGSLAVLSHFSPRSPQAKHYHEILTNLWAAVEEYRRQREDDRRRMTNQFLNPMFAEAPNNEDQLHTYPSPLSSENVDASIAGCFSVDEVLSSDLDVDLSATFPLSWDFHEDGWRPFCWGLDGS